MKPAAHRENESTDSDAAEIVPIFAVRRNGVADEMDRHLRLQLNLCCMLEKLADELPDDVNRQECLHVARSIYPIVKNAHAFEEDLLFPRLASQCRADSNMSSALERLRFEHWEDESFGCELGEELLAFAQDPASANIDALSYMLRGFFEGLRRHIAYEREQLLPILLKNSSPAAPDPQ